MTKEQLNETALQKYNNLREHAFFENLEIIEADIKNNKTRLDYEFYLAKQDELNSLYGEIENVYAELNSLLEKYLVDRTLRLMIEMGTGNNKEVILNGQITKVTSSTLSGVLSKVIKGEISDLYQTVLILESKVKRVINNLQTVRNHTYVKKENQSERGI